MTKTTNNTNSGINQDDYRVKMVMLTRGDLKNKAWKNFEKENNKPIPEIISSLRKRFERHPIQADTKILQFYDQYGVLLEEQRF